MQRLETESEAFGSAGGYEEQFTIESLPIDLAQYRPSTEELNEIDRQIELKLA
jgi:hypothetical protein